MSVLSVFNIAFLKSFCTKTVQPQIKRCKSILMCLCFTHMTPSVSGQSVGRYNEAMTMKISLTHLSLASILRDIGKQNSPRCDAAERGVPSGAILFAQRIFIVKLNKI